METVKLVLKKVGVDLYERIVLANKSTLLALVLTAADIIVQNLLAVNNPVVHAIAFVASTFLALYKGQARLGAKKVTVDVPPAALALLVGGALLFAAPARAQDATPPAAPLAVQLSPDFSLHLNVAVPAFGYSLTRNQFLGQLTFGLAYALDYKQTIAVGVGGGYLQTNDTPGVTITGMLGGPVLPFELAAGTKLRPAALYEYTWHGGEHEQIIAGTLALQF